MSIDGRILITAAVVAGFAGGYVVRAQLDMAPPPAAPLVSTPPQPPPPPLASPTPEPEGSSMTAEATKKAFEDIYRKAGWGTNGGDAGVSGYGSTMEATAVYRTFLQQFMKDADVKTVVDAGCGDWESTQALDWKGIDYKGYDIVESVIERDKKRFEKPNVHFFTADIVETELPPADLLIVKQVLQHLPNASVTKFLKQLPKYKHALIMNSVSPRNLSADNRDIVPGYFRLLDITRAPFGVVGAKVLTYWDGGNMEQLVHVSAAR